MYDQPLRRFVGEAAIVKGSSRGFDFAVAKGIARESESSEGGSC
jgi:hypothetical protein